MLVAVRARTCRWPGAGSATASAARKVANTVVSVSHTAVVARIAGPLLVALMVAGCGASGGGEQLRAWTAAAPYLPPPSAHAQAKSQPRIQAHAPAPRVAALKGPVAQAADGVAQG